MNTNSKEKYSEAAATKLTPRQLAFANLAMTFSKILNDPEFQFKSEREGQGETSAFYRAAILYYSEIIMRKVREKSNGVNLLDWVEGKLDD